VFLFININAFLVLVFKTQEVSIEIAGMFKIKKHGSKMLNIITVLY